MRRPFAPALRAVLGRVLCAVLGGALCGLLAACGSDARPEVTWRAGGTEQAVGPAQYCDNRLQNCSNDEAAQARLAVPAGTPVEISVPGDVSQAPWSVVFAYAGTDGARVDGRSPVFAPNAQDAYTLTLPDPADTLLTAQVQVLGVAPVANPESGELEYPARATWILVAN